MRLLLKTSHTVVVVAIYDNDMIVTDDCDDC